MPFIRQRMAHLRKVSAVLQRKLVRLREDLADKAAMLQTLVDERQVALNTAAEFAISSIIGAMMTTEELNSRSLLEIDKIKAAVMWGGAGGGVG